MLQLIESINQAVDLGTQAYEDTGMQMHEQKGMNECASFRVQAIKRGLGQLWTKRVDQTWEAYMEPRRTRFLILIGQKLTVKSEFCFRGSLNEFGFNSLTFVPSCR